MTKWVLFILLLNTSVLQAKVEFGAKAGYSLSQHYGVKDDKDDYTVQSSFQHGFTGGFYFYLPITDRFGMQYESNYVQKGSNQVITVSIFEERVPLAVSYETDYLEFPILLRYSFPISPNVNYKALTGTAMSLLVRNNYQLDGVIADEDGEVRLNGNERNFAMEQFDFSLVYGGELYYRWKELNMVLGYRFTIGWNTLNMPTYAYIPFAGEEEPFFVDNPPVELKNQAYAFTFGIIF